MTLPRLSGSVFVLLSADNTTPTTVRSPGTPVASLVLTGGPPVFTQLQQPDFYASQFWYQGYPDEVITTINAPDAPREDSVAIQGFANTALTIANTFPNFVTAYDPTPAPGPAEPVPNPNGTTSNNSSQASKTWPLPSYRPRWYTDTVYDLPVMLPAQVGTLFPPLSTDFLIQPNNPPSFSADYVSANFTVNNLQSWVLNEQTNLFEYYNFGEPEYEYTQTCKFKVILTADNCCWDSGAIINVEVGFMHVDCTAVPVGTTVGGSSAPDYGSSYGFAGMKVTTGAAYAVSVGLEETFSIEVGNYTPTEITIPVQAGKITFINDFVVYSVVPPPA
jgi:hypothetical protein